MISGGNFDFYDNELPAYILQVKFDYLDTKLQDIIITKIRHTFPNKFEIFPSTHSIGAYWVTDTVSEDMGINIIQRLVQNCIRELS